jgi:hypothetical protein
VGKPEIKRSLGRPRRRWVDNNKMHLRGTVWFVMEWIYLAQDQWSILVSTEMNLRGEYNVGKLLSSQATDGF